MKYLILTAIATLAFTASSMASPNLEVTRSVNAMEMQYGDKSFSIIVDTTNTTPIVTLAINGDTITREINNLANSLNDTVLSSSTNQDDAYDMQALIFENEMGKKAMNTGIFIVGIIFLSIILIVIACLVVYYRNRRNRFKVIEKAIENGYQLPDSFYGGSSRLPNNNAPQETGQTKHSTTSQIFSSVSEYEIQKGVTQIIVWFGVGLFLLLLGLNVLAALTIIPLMLAVAKILIPYFRHKYVQPPVPPQPENHNQQPSQNEEEPPIFTNKQ